MYYSPLRYPGGKRNLAPFIKSVCKVHGIDGHYVEPYAGGAAVGLELLLTGQVRKITINDLDKSIYAFWKSVVTCTDDLCEKILNTKVNIKNWEKAKKMQANKKDADILDLGFSTLFLNRTNYSGVLNGGILGGKNQNGVNKIDCRFHKNTIIERIMHIAEHRKQIHVHNKDAIDLIKRMSDSHDGNMLYYFDPPYYSKGAYLYMNHYQKEDHRALSKVIQNIRRAKWIVSYDNVSEIRRCYSKCTKIEYSLYHTARSMRVGKEIMFYSNNLNKFNKVIAKIPIVCGVAA